MTPLEFIGATALGYITMKLMARLFFRSSTMVVPEDLALQQCRESFHAGFLCAADMVTHSGHEELAGQMRLVAQKAKVANDN